MRANNFKMTKTWMIYRSPIVEKWDNAKTIWHRETPKFYWDLVDGIASTHQVGVRFKVNVNVIASLTRYAMNRFHDPIISTDYGDWELRIKKCQTPEGEIYYQF